MGAMKVGEWVRLVRKEVRGGSVEWAGETLEEARVPRAGWKLEGNWVAGLAVGPGARVPGWRPS